MRELLNLHFFRIRVEGEVSNLTLPSSGHMYFSLKDDAAQIRCALFRPQMRRTAFMPKNGQHVIITAQVSLYEPRGDYQLIVEHIEDAGIGVLQRAFLQLKEKLAAEGLFDAVRKRVLPTLPACIGVITSPTGAALRDVLSVLKRRCASVPVIIYPSAVQGEAAKAEIVSALTIANQRCECDVLIVARGGGALEDLWTFNEESVARAIAASRIPVIAAIGHETDFTIADFVADLRAPTPSAAAEHAVPDQQILLRQFRQGEARLLQQLLNRFNKDTQYLSWLGKRLQQQHPGRLLQNNAQHLDDLEIRLNQARRLLLQRGATRVENLQLHLNRFHPQTQIHAYRLNHRYLAQRLNAAIELQLRNVGEQLAMRSQALHTVSPLATLQRGYAIVTVADENSPLTSTADLQLGMALKTRLANGTVVSRIESLDNN